MHSWPLEPWALHQEARRPWGYRSSGPPQETNLADAVACARPTRRLGGCGFTLRHRDRGDGLLTTEALFAERLAVTQSRTHRQIAVLDFLDGDTFLTGTAATLTLCSLRH